MAKKKASSDESTTSTESPMPRSKRAAPRRTSTRVSKPAGVTGSSAERVATAADAPSPTNAAEHHTPSYEEIAEAAYHRFLLRGGNDGRDFDDWIEAERELRLSRTRGRS